MGKSERERALALNAFYVHFASADLRERPDQKVSNFHVVVVVRRKKFFLHNSASDNNIKTLFPPPNICFCCAVVAIGVVAIVVVVRAFEPHSVYNSTTNG